MPSTAAGTLNSALNAGLRVFDDQLSATEQPFNWMNAIAKQFSVHYGLRRAVAVKRFENGNV